MLSAGGVCHLLASYGAEVQARGRRSSVGGAVHARGDIVDNSLHLSIRRSSKSDCMVRMSGGNGLCDVRSGLMHSSFEYKLSKSRSA